MFSTRKTDESLMEPSLPSLLEASQDETFSSINITPLVDVILVLLVIFLMTAPSLYQSALSIQLPAVQKGEPTQKNALSFSLSREGKIYWNDQPILWDKLPHQLASYLAGKKQKLSEEIILIQADEAAPHGTVIKLIDCLRQQGAIQFALSVQDTRP